MHWAHGSSRPWDFKPLYAAIALWHKRSVRTQTEENLMLEEGDAAPKFKLGTGDGETVALKDFAGKTVVLYFYPKDLTTGCTKQACDFRDAHAKLRRKGVVVLGVSRDSAASHIKFKEKHDLPFTLLVDADGAMSEAYGVWKEKSMYGRKYFGIERSTFIIDGRGRIARIFRKVKVPGHVEAVIDSL